MTRAEEVVGSLYEFKVGDRVEIAVSSYGSLRAIGLITRTHMAYTARGRGIAIFDVVVGDVDHSVRYTRRASEMTLV